MIKIKLTTPFPEWPLVRQTPGSKGIWGDCQFFVNQDIEECDFWVVYEGLFKPEKTVCSPENTILITSEPPTVKKYLSKYVSQFATLITCHREIQHPNVIYMQQCLPWMVGGRFVKETKTWESNFSKDYDELIDLQDYKKDKLLSIILSKKNFTEGHSKRLLFVNKLKEHFGEDLDIYGVGINEIIDKWDGISRYKYYLAVENCSYPDYWTEKLSDAFLGGAYPFYYGCPNINKYFSENSLTPIDINNLSAAVKTIEDHMTKHKYEESLVELRYAKDKVLNKYNLFAMLSEYCAERKLSNRKNEINLKPESFYMTRASAFINKLLRK